MGRYSFILTVRWCRKMGSPIGSLSWTVRRLDDPPDLPVDSALHVWRLPIDVPPVPIAELASLLAPDETARAVRFRAPVRRDRFVAARGLLRVLLAAYVSTDPRCLCFTYGPHGKPELASSGATLGLHFNLAHCKGWALIAIACAGPIGVDMEQLPPLVDSPGLAAVALAPNEQTALARVPSNYWPTRFLSYWICKEAVLKATGIGLYQPLRTVEIGFERSCVPRLLAIGEDVHTATRWSLVQLTLAGVDDAMLGAVAAPWPDAAVACYCLSD
jgi:4'-phosphopantetheinyl transferase